MSTKLNREARSAEISADRLLLENPYAHLDANGGYSALKKITTKNASQIELKVSRTILQNPYAHQLGDGTFEAISQKKSNYSIEDIEKKVAAIHKLIWRSRHKLWQKPPSNPIELLDPIKAIEALGYTVSIEAGLGEIRVSGRAIEAAGIIDNQNQTVRLSRNYKPEILRYTAAHELGHILMHDQSGLHRDRPIDGIIKAREPIEFQADNFAALFLMPRRLVIEKFKQIYITNDLQREFVMANLPVKYQSALLNSKSTRDVSRVFASCDYFRRLPFRSLASQFNVSIEAMAIRLEQLKLIPIDLV